MGGSYTHLKDQGYAWDNKEGKWVQTKSFTKPSKIKY